MKKSMLLFLLAAAISLAGCHKDPPKSYEETDMTVTYYNDGFDFSTYNTFFLPDSTLLKTNYMSTAQVSDFYEDGGLSEQTLALRGERFRGLGYSEVLSADDADFIAVPTILMMKSDETVWYGPGWWWGYPGYGWGIGIGFGFKGADDYWGWWYPVYPWYPQGVPVTVSTYTGTMVFEMLDGESYRTVLEWEATHPDPQPEDNPPKLEINWQAMIEGYSTDDGEYNRERALRGVDEAFAQSPYLNK